MRSAALALGLILAAGPALAQTAVTPAPGFPLDLSGVVPAPCGTTPAPDTLNGSVGSGACYTRSTDTRPTVVQAQIVTTDATGAWSLTWAKAFASATPYINAQPINTGTTQPYICNVAASTTTTASGKCWVTTTMTIPAVVLGAAALAINPTGAAASIQVRVAARDLTQ